MKYYEILRNPKGSLEEGEGNPYELLRNPKGSLEEAEGNPWNS